MTPTVGDPDPGVSSGAVSLLHPVAHYPRLTALVAILLTSLNLRTAITALSPLVPRIQESLGFGAGVVGVLGMIPTAMFACSAFATPGLMRRLTTSQVMLAAMLITTLGQLLRVAGESTALLLAGSLVALFAIGVTNTALPVAVREYFPNRVAGVSISFLVSSQLFTAAAPLFAEPIALWAEQRGLGGWQFSLGSWAVLGAVAAITWLPLLHRRGENPDVKTPSMQMRLPVWRTPVGLGLALMFGFTSFVTYSLMTFLPQLFVEAGTSPQFGALMLAYWTLLGLPLNVLGPWLVGRFRQPYPAVVVACLLLIIGNLGLAFTPMSAPWVWVTLSGLGPLAFPMALTLLNTRARTTPGATALSAFGQGTGYTLASAGPLLVGFLHALSTDFRLAVWVLLAATVAVAAGAWFVTREVFVEDQIPAPGSAADPTPSP